MDAERALAGARVLVPRAAEQAAELSDRIRALGGEPVEAPVLLIGSGDQDALEAAVDELAAGGFVAVCLTSPNGVRGLAAALRAREVSAQVLAEVDLLACVGPGTATALAQELDLTPDLVPATATTAALGEAMPSGTGRVLLPRADIASPVLPEQLRAKGYDPVEVVAYRTGRPDALPPEVLEDLASGTITHVAVASPSTARNLVALLGGGRLAAAIVSIGPVTSAACHDLGLPVAAEGSPHDVDGLVAAIAAHHRQTTS